MASFLSEKGECHNRVDIREDTSDTTVIWVLMEGPAVSLKDRYRIADDSRLVGLTAFSSLIAGLHIFLGVVHRRLHWT